jgi:RimJ/RimL family protein N-acetyltransferase
MDARSFIARDTLKDGTPVVFRAVRSDDTRRLVDAFAGLERSTVYTRFFGYKQELSAAELARIESMDFAEEVMIVATVAAGDEETIVGSGRYVATPGGPERGVEVAFTVEEDYQGRGIASRLLRHLVAIARAQGFARLEADVLAENRPMLAVFERCGLPMRQQREGTTVHVSLSLH